MRIVACGDMIFSCRGLRHRFDPAVAETLRSADAVFANAEFACPAPDTPPIPRRFITALDEYALDEIESVGVTLVSLANNHTGDFGSVGVTDTLDAAARRGMIAAGTGRNLEEARSARFLDTEKGRIALIAATTTRAAEFAASSAGGSVPARPGVNPLRWNKTYVLPAAEYDQLRQIDEKLGTAASRREVMRVEVMPDQGDDRFKFGSVFDGALQIERGERPEVRYGLDERDRKAILAHIRDAANRADFVFFSLHTHEGEADNWYSPAPASFVETISREAIEAGATAVFGHGAHMLRGIEFHQGRPIFYSLNSLVMDFESGEAKISPEMYESYGFAADSLPSMLHRSRARDAEGNRLGFYAEDRFSQSVAAICDFDGDRPGVKLVPIDLDLNRDRIAERGMPMVAAPQVARRIADDLAAMSERYGTKIAYDAATGMITATK